MERTGLDWRPAVLSAAAVPSAARACSSGGESGSHLLRDRLRLLVAKRVVLLWAIVRRERSGDQRLRAGGLNG
jgi:hypothetical protein